MRSLVLLSPLVAACGTMGAMHQVSMSDAGKHAPQAPLAVGTRFFPELASELAGTTTPNLRLESVDPTILAVDGGALVAKAPGASAVLISADDGSVVDFIHVWVAPVTNVTLAKRDGERVEGSIGLTVGEDLTLVPMLWNGAQKLSGDGGATWTASDETMLAIMNDGSRDRRRLRARAPGKTTITVALGETKASIDVEVVQ